jgi:DNA-binding response OmpR family regulator
VANILIVDDDARVATSVAAHLTRAGHVCTVHNTGADVVEMAERGAFDLLLLDLMLPVVSGFELCRRVRRNPELYTIPVLIISSMCNEEEVMHGLSQGADDFIAKPFDLHEVAKRVESLLHSHSARSRADALTGLLGAETIKREIQRKISKREPFVLAYAELLNLRQFGYKKPDARNKAIRHLGRALAQCAEGIVEEQLVVGHMGGGHFAVVLPRNAEESYCERVYAAWNAHLGKFYESAGESKAYHDGHDPDTAGTRAPLLDVLMCLAPWDKKDALSAKELFEIVTKIRYTALEKNRGGIYKDRRNSPLEDPAQG